MLACTCSVKIIQTTVVIMFLRARGLVRCTGIARGFSRCLAISTPKNNIDFRSTTRVGTIIQKRSYGKTPKIGVAVTILRPIKNREDQFEVLLIKRGKQPALDMWSSAGGHLE